MSTPPPPPGRLAENILHFARALRKAGVKVGPVQVAAATQAVAAAGFSRRDDFYHILRACLITRADHLELYHQVFMLFWRDPAYLERMIHMMSPLLRREEGAKEKPRPAERRATEAMADLPPPDPRAAAQARELVETDARFSFSVSEVLRGQDFEQMSVAERAEAEAALRALRLPLPRLPGRRARAALSGGRADLRATLRRAMRRGGEVERILTRHARPRRPDLVVLCDISGSMTVYSRMLLLFLHAMAQDPHRGFERLHAFTFGTRLTNITRALARRDADSALAAAGAEAPDWKGGTRIGAALVDFNRLWSRRVLGQGALVLLITDGLEREGTATLSAAAERLHLSCRRLVWLNPLLRWDGFTPLAGGIKALMPHVDALHACHSLDSLADLAKALSADGLRHNLS
jgi:uncharacterized protein